MGKKNGVELNYSIPYSHESNGRVERVNVTIREANKKTGVILKQKLPQIILAYNNAFHRGIRLSHEEALKEKNFVKVREHQKLYSKEFGKVQENITGKFSEGQKGTQK